MSGEQMAVPPPRRAGRLKRQVLLLLGTMMLLAAPLPTPSPASAAEAAVTVSVTVLPNPIEITVRIPSQVREGVPFPVLAFIENGGDLSIEEAVAAIHVPGGIEVIIHETVVDLGTVRTHGSTAAMWLLRAVEKGNYVILVSASGVYRGDIISAQDATLVTVGGR